ncbi:hypothetical protein ACWIUD_09155 [Helicobacter sp. 23-1044]
MREFANSQNLMKTTQILRIWIATLDSLARNDEMGVDSANFIISQKLTMTIFF